MSEPLKKRAPNFSGKEKTVLLNIVFNHKNVIENKKTDGVTWRQKDEAWSNIAAVFNSQMPESFPRSKESLKKLYGNIKKHVRKEVVNGKKEIVKTGGGPPDHKPDKDPIVELALGIINQKTVYGLKNNFDSDFSVERTEQSPSSCTDGKSDPKSGGIEFVVLDDLDLEHSYSMSEIPNGEFELNELPSSVTPTMPREQVLADPKTAVKLAVTPKDRKTQHIDWGDFSVNNLRQPAANELKHTWTKRRRPTIQQLSSNQLTEEYSKLAKLKHELYEAEKENVLRRRQREEEIFELQKRKLQLDIELKEMEIKKFRESV